jgi:ribosome-binding factor A
MSSRRVQKVAEAVREVVSWNILTRVRDPRVENVTVTAVEVSADLRTAKVHVSIMGDEAKQKLCMHGLQNSAGFLQGCLGERLTMRYTPRITFKLDKGVKHSLEVQRILSEVLPPGEPAVDNAEPPTADVESDKQ